MDLTKSFVLSSSFSESLSTVDQIAAVLGFSPSLTAALLI